MSTNFAKTLVWKHEYDVKLWRHKDCTPQTNDHHTLLNEPPHENFLRTPLLLAFQPQSAEDQQNYRQARTILSAVPHLIKLHQLTTHEERVTQDGGPRVHKAHQQEDVWTIPASEGDSVSDLFTPEELSNALNHLEPGKSLGLDSIFPEFILHAESALKFVFAILHFLHAPTQNSQELEKSTSRCDP